MKEPRKANLFVVGAMKAGTTSFIELLSEHPQIYVSPIKEPHYFVNELPKILYEPSRFFSLEEYFLKEFPQPMHIAQVKKQLHYEQLFSLSTGETYLAEGSTAYLHALESPELLYNYNSEARIVILRRDPLKRAHSHYNMNLGMGREKRSFNACMELDIRRYHEGILDPFSYLGMSLYDKAIERFSARFDKVQIIDLENLISNEEKELTQLASFLQIDPFEELDVSKRNEGKTLHFQKFFYLMKQLGLKDYFSKFFSNSFRQKLFNLFSSDRDRPMKLNKETERQLQDIFNIESNY